jgi:hypothetical protein
MFLTITNGITKNILSGGGNQYGYDILNTQIVGGISPVFDQTGSGWDKLSSQTADGFYNLTVETLSGTKTVLFDTVSGHAYTFDGSNLIQDGNVLATITSAEWAALEAQAV